VADFERSRSGSFEDADRLTPALKRLERLLAGAVNERAA
jgi:hypothetical protein